jgi:2-polyprenyl-6-methoxyphenol hydroxylase-like FAD-dependent oxidoreductase
MNSKKNRVIIVGAGPVGLCLALALTQAEVPVTLIESLSDDNFLDQIPRAGTNHPATVELFDRIDLYKRIEPRGMIAPVVHYWERQGPELVAEFDHAVLKNDTPFPYVLQCERIKIIEEALAMVNDHEYGNGCAIFTRDGDAARDFAARAQAGMVGINVPVPAPLAYYSFGGWKRSVFGDLNQHGPDAIKFWTRTKTVTARWPTGLRSGAQFHFSER